MYRSIIPLSSVFLLSGCGSMFDLAGVGNKDPNIYYDVKANKIIDSTQFGIEHIYIYRNRGKTSYPSVDVKFDEPAAALEIPLLKDSIAFYDFRITIYIEGEHGRLHHLIKITQKQVRKKQKIYSRWFNH